MRDRASYAFALASAAVALDVNGGTIRDARVALGGVATKPWRAREAERALIGQPPRRGGISRRRGRGAVGRGAADAQRLQDRARETHARARADVAAAAGAVP